MRESGGRFIIVRRILEVAFVILFLVQIYLNVRLRQRVQSLQTSLAEARRSAASDKFRLGEVVTPLPVRAKDGREFVLNPAAARKALMLLVIDPASDASRAALDDLLKVQLKRRAVVIVSVKEKGVWEAAAPTKMADFTYTLLPSAPLNTKLKFSQTPTVLLLSPTARITKICDRPRNCV